jgi:hypothetical protein
MSAFISLAGYVGFQYQNSDWRKKCPQPTIEIDILSFPFPKSKKVESMKTMNIKSQLK